MPIRGGCPLGKTCYICDMDNIKCSVKGLVYEAECLECQKVSNDVGPSPKYIGESARPFRLRVNEHFTNLRNWKLDSFMLEHWMTTHGLNMTPPKFQFKSRASYKDSMTRQLAEALLIEEEGSLNKRFEYGSNHLCRLESSIPDWECEKLREVEAMDKANRISNLHNFVTTVKNVMFLCENLSTNDPTNCAHTYRSIKRAVEMEPKEENKRLKAALVSTPKWEYRKSVEDWLEISPIEKSPVFELSSSLGSSFSRSTSMLKSTGVETLGLTPQLRKLLLKPKNESEEEESKKLLIETINLTRAALSRGLIDRDVILEEELVLRLDMNPFQKCSQVRNIQMNNLNGLSDRMDNLKLEHWQEDEDLHMLKAPTSVRKIQGVLCKLDKIKDMELEYQHFKFMKGVPVIINTLKKAKMEESLDLGSSPKLKSRKRSFSPSVGTQLGSLPKHSTSLKKKDGGQRKNLNQTFFVGTPERNFSLSTKIQTQGSGESIKRKKVGRRRLTSEGRQSLITSVFSPRQMRNSGDVVKKGGDDGEKETL